MKLASEPLSPLEVWAQQAKLTEGVFPPAQNVLRSPRGAASSEVKNAIEGKTADEIAAALKAPVVWMLESLAFRPPVREKATS